MVKRAKAVYSRSLVSWFDAVEMEQAEAGDIVRVTGLDTLDISDTLCSVDAVDFAAAGVTRPVTMTFQVNNSPLPAKTAST